MERVADYVINRLADEGIKHIFMVTGRGILYLSDAVARTDKMESISTHHEQAAAFAAVAYSEATNNLGAALVSTGCASTNTITGVLCAWQDNIPCVFISGQNKLNETTRYTGTPIRTFGNQEADIISLVEPITKYATMVTDANQIRYEMDKAIHLATEGRKGPVWIDIPLDVQNMRVNPEMLEGYTPAVQEKTFVKEDLLYIQESLKNAKRPVLLIGSGIKSAGAIKELHGFLDKNPMPVVFSNAAVDVYGAGNKYSLGIVASIGGTRCANFAIQNADLLLVVGCRLSPQLTGEEYDKFAREAQTIVVDIDPIEHSKNTVKIDKFIECDAKQFLSTITNEDFKQTEQTWLDKCLHWKAVFPKCEERYVGQNPMDLHEVAQMISDKLKSDDTIVCDSGLTELIIPSVVHFKDEQRCIHSASQGSMGYALPAAIGAYYGSDKGNIYAVIGDGSIMMNLQELQTIAHYNLPIKIIIINNNLYSVIRTRQEALFRSRTIGTDESNGVSAPNFEKVANAFNLNYIKVEKFEELEEGLNKLENMSGPTICEIYCTEDQQYLHSSFGLNSKKRIVKKPIEDQKPFLDREIFLREMVIDPIDQ